LKVVLYGFLLAAAALPMFAQSETAPERVPPPAPAPEARPLRSTVELQYYNFGNFFQAPEGLPQRNVTALGAAYRAAWTPRTNGPELYGRLSGLRYSGGASETSYTGTAGISKYGSVHWYDFYVERTENGYAFDIDETRASANITALSGHYSYAITRDWRVGTDAYLDWTRFNVDAQLENDYQSLGFDVRYRGFGDLIQPRVGYVMGQRDSRNGVDDADDRYWFVELRTKPRDTIDVRLRFRDRTRDYANIARVDDREQWTLRATLKQNQHLSWNASYSLEDVDSTAPGRDYDRSTASLTLSYGF
jgi:hypothetical protein